MLWVDVQSSAPHVVYSNSIQYVHIATILQVYCDIDLPNAVGVDAVHHLQCLDHGHRSAAVLTPNNQTTSHVCTKAAVFERSIKVSLKEASK
jgi:hypothetical protein